MKKFAIFLFQNSLDVRKKILKKIKQDMKIWTQKMKKQEKSKIEASSILNSLQLKRNSKAFSKSSTEIILKCLKSNKLSIQNNLMKTKIENNIFHKLKSTFMPHCATDQRK